MTCSWELLVLVWLDVHPLDIVLTPIDVETVKEVFPFSFLVDSRDQNLLKAKPGVKVRVKLSRDEMRNKM